jgi:hypothetical protein
MPPGVGLPEYIVYRVFAFRLGPLNQRIAEASLFNLLGCHSVPVYVLDSVLRPDKLVDSHCLNYSIAEGLCKLFGSAAPATVNRPD